MSQINERHEKGNSDSYGNNLSHISSVGPRPGSSFNLSAAIDFKKTKRDPLEGSAADMSMLSVEEKKILWKEVIQQQRQRKTGENLA